MSNNYQLLEYLLSVTSAKDSDQPSECEARYWIYARSPSSEGFGSTDKTGKWCIFTSRNVVDSKWAKVREAVLADRLVCAKVSTRRTTKGSKRFVICVYTRDWADRSDLEQTREVLRSIGFKRPLKYKRDLETINRVYNTPDEFFLTL